MLAVAVVLLLVVGSGGGGGRGCLLPTFLFLNMAMRI